MAYFLKSRVLFIVACFVFSLQSLSDESFVLPQSTIKLLESAKGKEYIESLNHKFPDCSIDIQGCDVVCASKSDQQLQAFQNFFENLFVVQKCKVGHFNFNSSMYANILMYI